VKVPHGLEEGLMSPRKPTIDDVDDIDDEDGELEDEKAQETDLDLTIARAEEVARTQSLEFDQEEER
jgi:hypothetical protein